MEQASIRIRFSELLMIALNFAGTITAGRQPILTSSGCSSQIFMHAFDAETPVAHPP
jgi:hypothetical protein